MKVAPARTRGTRWGALTARQRVWADSISLNAMATPAARLPGPLVTRVRSLTVAKVDSIGFVVRRWTQCSASSAMCFASLLGLPRSDCHREAIDDWPCHDAPPLCDGALTGLGAPSRPCG
jgi:hypothetical protein